MSLETNSLSTGKKQTLSRAAPEGYLNPHLKVPRPPGGLNCPSCRPVTKPLERSLQHGPLASPCAVALNT